MSVSAVPPAPDSPAPFDAFAFETSSGLLQGYLEFRQRTSRYFSVTSWARKLGFRNSGVIVNLVKKRRAPQEALVAKLSASMGLHGEAAEYYATLAAYERAAQRGAVSVPLLRRKLDALRFRAKNRLLSEEETDSLSDLAAAAAKEMLALRGAEADAAWLVRKTALPLPPAEAARMLERLAASGFLVHSADGKTELAGEHVESTHGTPSAALRRFHRESLEHAVRAIEGVPLERRYFSSYLFPIRQDRLAAAKAALDRAIDEFVAEFEEKRGEGDQIYQLNLNFIPLTQEN